MNTLYIVMPAYNEEPVIQDVVKTWYPLLNLASEGSRLVIDATGSTDQTIAILQNLQKDYPQLFTLINENRYHGPKLIALYQYALKQGADYVFQTDSDGQTTPEDFTTFWNQRETYSAIFGNRTHRGDGLMRYFIEKVLCAILFLIFGVVIPDSNAPYRLMNRSFLATHIHKMPTDYPLPNVMLTVFAKKNKDNIKFEEIAFHARPSKGGFGSVLPIIRIGMKSIKEFIAFRRAM